MRDVFLSLVLQPCERGNQRQPIDGLLLQGQLNRAGLLFDLAFTASSTFDHSAS
jgi:hypothetical protein